jgi:DNA-binding beta-propeller fold protein YncE
MINFNVIRGIWIILLGTGLFSCKKETPIPPLVPNELSKGMLVLNEGLFQLNNSSLSWINFNDHSINSNFFTEKTERLLGDTGNDLKRYGNKIYVVVNVSSTLEILNASTGKSIKQISMIQGNQAKQPRNITFHGSKAYITCFDGYVDVLDTATLTIQKRIPVGLNPEDLIVSNNRLFVSNSGGLNGSVMDSTVSVIDLATDTELSKIVVGKNPGALQVDYKGDVYVITRGNYGSIPSRMIKINPIDLTVIKQYPFEASGIERFENQLLISMYNFTTQQNQLRIFDVDSDEISSTNFVDLSPIKTLYGVHYHPQKKQIILLDANQYTQSGFVRLYSNNGTFLKSYSVGLNPTAVLWFD